ncbi:MAG: adenylate/guanylate cyclase domain-containing protein [Candidatus Promineifilaceae bacterium]
MSPHLATPLLAGFPQIIYGSPYLRALLNRYLGRSVVNHILAGASDADEQVIYASVLFADIRDFTALAEATDERELFHEVNEYYNLLDDVITRYGGVINDFGGDSILALFGAPSPLEDHAAAALYAAADIMRELVHLNDERALRSRPAFRVGIGVNSGRMVMGNFGSQTRQTFTVIGDCVNSANRLSDLSKNTPFYSIFASQQTMSDVQTELPNEWLIDELGDIFVRGRTKALLTYAIMPDAFM